jgi:MFS family permease
VEETVTIPNDADEIVRKDYRHNFIFNYLDGATFWFGNSFIASSVILPLYVSHYTQNNFLIGLIAVIASAGYFLPQLFTSNWVEQAPIKKIFPVNYGFFLERVPMLIMPFTAALLAMRPVAALAGFFILYTWQIVGAGLIAVGWQDMIAKVVPIERRGFFMSLTNFTGTATGVAGTALSVYLLDHYAFPTGYVVCFALAGIFSLISWICISQTREQPSIERPQTVSHRGYVQKLFRVLKLDANFSRFLISQGLANLGGMAWGYVAVYVVERWSVSEGYVAAFTTVLLLGQSLGNLAFAFLADRFGYKLVVEIGAIAGALAMAVAILAQAPGWFYLAFALRGVTVGAGQLAMLIGMEFNSPDIRPTYMGLNNTTTGIIAFIAPLIGGALAQAFNYQVLFQAALVVTVAGLICLRLWVVDPRRAEKATIEFADTP